MLLLSETKEFFLGCLFCWCVLQLSAVFDSPLLALQSSAVLLHDHHHADQFSLWLQCHKSETCAWFVSSGQTRFFLECLTVESIPSSSAVSLSHFTAAYFVSTKLTLFVQSRCNTFIQLLTAMYDSDDPIAVSGTLALHSFRLWPLRSIVAVTIAAFSFDLRLFHRRHFG
jgi:hypothetical protein